MQDQPRYEAYESSPFFKDGLSSRPIVEGTVARGYLRADHQLYTGQKNKAQSNTSGTTPQAGQQSGANTQGGNASNARAEGGAGATAAGQQTPAAGECKQPVGTDNDVEEFPFPVTEDVMKRGRERYEIFCAMCHGSTGYGDGMIVRRGFRNPPSYHDPCLQQARVGYLFRVMTEGMGAMPSYRAQIPVQDRWAIAAYIRALQESQRNQRQAAPAAPAPAHGTNEPGGHK